MQADSARRFRSGFSLLEAIAALALLALVIGLTAPAMGRFLAEDAERRQLVDLVNLLSAERTEAIRLGRSVRIVLERDGDALLARRRGETRRWESWGARLLSLEGRPVAEEALVFEPSGRTTRRLILFESLEASDRIWEISFDPISGAPSMRERAEESLDGSGVPWRRNGE